jgi:hypothetical protein
LENEAYPYVEANAQRSTLNPPSQGCDAGSAQCSILIYR